LPGQPVATPSVTLYAEYCNPLNQTEKEQLMSEQVMWSLRCQSQRLQEHYSGELMKPKLKLQLHTYGYDICAVLLMVDVEDLGEVLESINMRSDKGTLYENMPIDFFSHLLVDNIMNSHSMPLHTYMLWAGSDFIAASPCVSWNTTDDNVLLELNFRNEFIRREVSVRSYIIYEDQCVISEGRLFMDQSSLNIRA